MIGTSALSTSPLRPSIALGFFDCVAVLTITTSGEFEKVSAAIISTHEAEEVALTFISLLQVINSSCVLTCLFDKENDNSNNTIVISVFSKVKFH